MFARPASPTVLAKGILLPWAFWSIAYGVVNLALRGYVFRPDLTPIGAVLYGTGVHLWYLPFIFIVCLLVGRFQGIKAEWVAAAMALLLFFAAPWWKDIPFLENPPFPQYIHVLPAVLIGLAFRSRAPALAVLVALVTAWVWYVPVPISYIVGAFAVLAALVIKEMRWNVQPVADCMFGVYLLHPMALTFTNFFLGRESFLGAVVAFLLSLGLTYLARLRIKPIRLVLR